MTITRDDLTRVLHHAVVGDTGSGKTYWTLNAVRSQGYPVLYLSDTSTLPEGVSVADGTVTGANMPMDDLGPALNMALSPALAVVSFGPLVFCPEATKNIGEYQGRLISWFLSRLKQHDQVGLVILDSAYPLLLSERNRRSLLGWLAPGQRHLGFVFVEQTVRSLDWVAYAVQRWIAGRMESEMEQETLLRMAVVPTPLPERLHEFVVGLSRVRHPWNTVDNAGESASAKAERLVLAAAMVQALELPAEGEGPAQGTLAEMAYIARRIQSAGSQQATAELIRLAVLGAQYEMGRLAGNAGAGEVNPE